MKLRLFGVVVCVFLGLWIQNNAAYAQGKFVLPVGHQVLKIEVDTDGIYEIRWLDLYLAGFDVANLRPDTIQMMYRGETVAYQWMGDDDPYFDRNESLRFYGWAFDGTQHEKRYTGDNNIFWLWGKGAPTRIAAVSNRHDDYPRESAFPDTVVYEENNHFVTTSVTRWKHFEADEWYWDRYDVYFHGRYVSYDRDGNGTFDELLYHPNPTYNLHVEHPAPTIDDAHFSAEFLTAKISDHHLTASLGSGSDSQLLKDEGYSALSASLLNADLQHGDNVLAIEGYSEAWRADRPLTSGRVWLNRITLSYWRQLVARDDTLHIHWPGGGAHQFDVTGFSEGAADNALVWNISDRLRPQQIVLDQRDIYADLSNQEVAMTWRIAIDEPNDIELLATTAAHVQTPRALSVYVPPAIQPAGGATWVAVTHRDFRPAVEVLADYRAADMVTHVVDVEDVINQVGYGFPLPDAIHDYMKNGFQRWQMRPRYLLLVGDATWNPTNRPCETCAHWRTDSPGFVPTYLQFIDPFQGMVSADYVYGQLTDNVYPDIVVGRLPAETSADIDAMIAKIILYEENLSVEEPQTHIFMPSDDTDMAGDFCATNDEMATRFIPTSYEQTRLCMDDLRQRVSSDMVQEQWRTTFFETVNEKHPTLINYRGHGTVTGWAGETITAAEAVAQWENPHHPAVFVAFDCLDTDFVRPGLPAISESLLKLRDGGTAAHYGSTGLGFNTHHNVLSDGFYTAIFDEGAERIGEAMLKSSRHYINTMGDGYQVYERTLLGDPAMLIQPPPKRVWLPLMFYEN